MTACYLLVPAVFHVFSLQELQPLIASLLRGTLAAQLAI
jgi:hypothetical protein